MTKENLMDNKVYQRKLAEHDSIFTEMVKMLMENFPAKPRITKKNYLKDATNKMKYDNKMIKYHEMIHDFNEVLDYHLLVYNYDGVSPSRYEKIKNMMDELLDSLSSDKLKNKIEEIKEYLNTY